MIKVIDIREQHAKVLGELSAEVLQTESRLIEHALALYQQVHTRAKQGYHVKFVDSQGQVHPDDIPTGLGIVE